MSEKPRSLRAEPSPLGVLIALHRHPFKNRSEIYRAPVVT